MQMPIKKSNNFMIKMFKTFTLYIFVTLGVFFGYVQIFGNVAPSVIQLPTDDTNADNDSFFGAFVKNMTDMKNVDTDFNLTFENSELKLVALGNAVFDKQTGSLSLDVDMIYNQQSFSVSAVFVSPNLFLTIDNSTYKFDTSGEMDLTGLIDFVSKSMNLDLSFIDDLSAYLGIDIKNFDPNDLLAKLKVEEKQLDDGGYEFVVGLGNILSAKIVCDEDFNIVTARIKDVLIQGNAIKFSANVNKMNKEDVSVDFEETGSEIDMSGLTQYAGFLQNTLKNDFVKANIKLNHQGKLFDVVLKTDNTNGFKVLFETLYEEFDIKVFLDDEVVYLNVNDFGLKMNLADYEKWIGEINKILENHFSQNLAEFVDGLFAEYLSTQNGNFDIQQTIKNMLDGGFSTDKNFSGYLPNETVLTDNSFSMIWNNGLRIDLHQENSSLTKLTAISPSTNLLVDFEKVDTGFEIEGEYYDLSNLLPLTNIVDEILFTKQFGGVFDVSYGSEKVSAKYVVDFSDGFTAKVSALVFGEDVSIYVKDKQIFVEIGEVVVEGDFDFLDDYLLRLEKTFGFDVSSTIKDILNTKHGDEISISQIVEILKNLALKSIEGKLAVVEYLSNKFEISVEENKILLKFENKNTLVDGFIMATESEIVLPVVTDQIENVFDKIESLKEFAQSKQYSFDFSIVYKQINLSGKIQIDLINNVFEISNMELGGNILNVVFAQNTLFVDYAGNKIKISVEDMKGALNILSGIIESNSSLGAFDLGSVLTEIFGQDIRDLSMKEFVGLIEISLSGNLDDLDLNLAIKTQKSVEGKVNVLFENDKLKSLNFEIAQIFGTLSVSQFETTTIDANEYYNLIATHAGKLVLEYQTQNEIVNLEFDIEVDLVDKIYLKISSIIMDSEVEILIYNNMLYLTVDNVVYGTNFDNVQELCKYIVDVFEITLPENNLNFEEIFSSLDLNGLNIFGDENFGLVVDGSKIEMSYKIKNLSINLICHQEEINHEIVLPENFEDLKVLIPKVKNILDYLQKGIFEFDFALTYNGLDLAGRFKYFNGDLEISNMLICGEYLNLRMHDNMIYVAFGNMKVKMSIANGFDTKALENIAEKQLGVVVDFGIFQEIVDIYKNYSINDYLQKMQLSVEGNSENLILKAFNKKEFSSLQIARAEINFENDFLKNVNIQIFDVLDVNLTLSKTDVSTIPEFDQTHFADYSTDYVKGLFDSLEVEEDIYAFGSDIAVRYSTNQFYGKLTARLVEDSTHTGILGQYVPAISLYTTSLGLETYIYLIDETIYLDVNGLQIQADLTQTTFEEILNFVETKLGIALGEKTQTLQVATEAFKIILPALDKIYGTWVSGLSSNGLQININDDLWYKENARFYDIVVQAFIQNLKNTIVPTKVVVGANIEDSNTTQYDDYSPYWLDCEDKTTQDLNFAVYLNNISVGSSVKNLNDVFATGNNHKEILAVKSNYGMTNLGDFNSYKSLLDVVETVYDYGMSFKYGIDVKGTIVSADSVMEIQRGDFMIEVGNTPEGYLPQFEFIKGKSLNIQGGLTIDNNGSSFSVDLMYKSLSSHDIYLTYALSQTNKFRAKINDSSLGDIISLAEKITGTNGQDIKDDITEIDKTLGSITDIVKCIKQINLTTNEETNETILKLAVDLEGKGAVGEIKIVLNKDENGKSRIDRISISNLSVAGKMINIEINMSESISEAFDYLAENPADKHIDFSGANELINALLNTSELNDYEIAGNLNINGNLIGIDINWKVPLNIKVKLDENRKPEVMAVVGEIPTLIGVNNDVPYEFGDTESGSGRMLYVYYKDGNVYFYRTEYIDIMFGASKRKFEKKLKVSIEEVLSDPLKYLKYCVGFTDAIIDAIQASLDLSKGHTPQLDNVVNSFTANDSSNFSVVLNMKEISNDPKLDTMSVGLGVVNSQATGNKNYIGKASLNMYMPLASVFKLTLDSNDLQLVDIGKQLDFAKLYDFVDSYTYNEGAYWQASNGNWSLASEVKYTILFEENGGTDVADITAAPSTEIILPNLDVRVEDNGIAKVTSTFDGWWTTADFKEGTRFTSNLMPRGDTKLYAKWIQDFVYYRTISFETGCSTTFDSITTLHGQQIELPILTTKEETVENTTTYYQFDGWYVDSAYTTRFDSTIMPDQDTVLYAKWVVTKVEQTYKVDVYDNEQLIYTTRVKAGESIDLSQCPMVDEKTKFYSDAGYSNEITDVITPSSDLDLHIRNEYTLSISSAYGNVFEYTGALYQGESIVLPTQNSYVEDDGNTRTTYTFLGYSENVSVMANKNMTIVANWEVEVKHYYTISFDLRWYLVYSCTAGAKRAQEPAPIEPIKVLEGTVLDLTQYQPTCKAYLTAIKIDAKNFKATSWGTSAWGDYTRGGSGFTSFEVVGNQTLYACWARA